MQSSGAPYQGPAQHGQYSDHNYDNPMAVHCPPSGYQGYVNGPYPVASPRPPMSHHHYGSHQMQQSYRGSYPPPPQNQYGPPPNQDMYRNHHSAYVGSNHNGNRNMPVKPVWGENNSQEMMPVYNHVPPSRPPMMPNSSAMNVSSMRSPPHLPANINPVPSPGAQHYRQMQSPGHSPQTWPHTQVPSPVMPHAARATPSPLPPHARSPGHSQPFSPPSATHMTAMPNMAPHPVNPVLPENCPSSAMGNQPVQNKADPLHSLQKMVMLDQTVDAVNCHMPSENCEQIPIQNEEPKDSNYATYFNLDENRLESEPQSIIPKPAGFIAGNTNEYNINSSSHVMNSDLPTDVNHSMKSPNLHILNSTDTMYTNTEQPHVVAPQTGVSTLSQPLDNQCKNQSSHIPEAVPKTAEPRLGNSAPIIENSEEVPNSSAVNFSESQNITNSSNTPNCTENFSKEDTTTNKSEQKPEVRTKSPLSMHSEPEAKDSVEKQPVLKEAENIPVEKSEAEMPEVKKKSKSPSIVKLIALKPAEEVIKNSEVEHKTAIQLLIDCVLNEVVKMNDIHEYVENETLIKQEIMSEEELVETKFEITAGENSENSSSKTLLNDNVSPSIVNGSTLKSIIKSPSCIKSEISCNPVKVLIHRLKPNTSNDAWHVSKAKSPPKKPNIQNSETPISKSGSPQIIVLTSAMSPKQHGQESSENPSSSNPEKSSKVVTNNRTAVNKTLASRLGASRGGRRNRINGNRGSSSSDSPRNSPQKGSLGGRGRGRGRNRTVVDKTKDKSGTNKRKGKTKRNLKDKRRDTSESGVPKVVKKIKPFHGPYVHLTGSKQKPESITVVNMAVKDDEKAKALLRTKPENVPKQPRVGHTSTLSPHYDAFNRDRTWMCIFCHKGSHCSGLGDLYGPYYIKNDETSKDSSNTSKATAASTPVKCGVRSKRRKSDTGAPDNEKPSTSKRSKMSNKVENPASSSQGTQQSSSDNSLKEVWIHEDCAVWCQSISLMGAQIRGLDEATQEAKEHLCSSCKLNGATLGCWCKGCKEQYHYSCAKDKGCQLDVENFSLFCPKHKMKKTLNSPKNVKKMQ